MSIHDRDILFYAGGAAWEKYGTLLRRTQTPRFGGEELAETFARTGTVTWVDRDGVLRTAADGVVRPHFPLVDGVRVAHTRLEGARTNLFLRSEEFDNAAWTKAQLSVSANQHTAPDGTTTADRLVENATASVERAVYQGVTATADGNYAVTFRGKDVGGGRNWIRLQLDDDPGSNWVRLWFNIATGTVGSNTSNGTAAFVRSVVETLGDGWYEVTLVGSVGSASTSIRGLCFIATADLVTTYTGDGSSYLAIWGAQFEDNVSFPSSYTKTTTASATRNADQLSADLLAPPQAMTIYVRFIEVGSVFGTDQLILALIGTNTNGRVQIRVGTSTGYSAELIDAAGGSNISTLTGHGAGIGDVVELRVTLSDAGVVQVHGSVNGGAELSANPSAALALDDTWGAQLLWLNSLGPTTTNTCFAAYRAVIVARGTGYSMGDCREWLP